MSEKFLSYGRQDINEEDIQAVISTLKSEFLTQGPAVEEFETAFSKYTGILNTVAVSNGTAALHLACLALEIGPGDAVIVPSTTFAATANSVLYSGATPIFVDTSPEDLGLSFDSAEEAVYLAKKNGLRLKAIFPVHFAGKPVDLKKLTDFARSKHVFVVEDACHALGAEYREDDGSEWKHVGNHENHIGIFSFHPVKHITTGEGGALTTNDSKVASRLRELRSHGITRDSSQFINHERAFDGRTGIPNPWYHEMQTLGYNYRICDIQASLGRSQIQRASQFVARRREIAERYSNLLRNHDPILKLPPMDGRLSKHSYHLFPVQIDFKKLGKSRAQVMEELKAAGVGSQVHYIPVSEHPFYRNNPKLWLKVSNEVAKAFYESELSIPMFPSMDSGDIERVEKALKSVLRL